LGGDKPHIANVSMSAEVGSFAQFMSEDETVVNHLSARVRELLARAAETNPPQRPDTDPELDEALERERERQLEAPRYVKVVTDVLPRRPKSSLVRRIAAYVYEHFVKAIVIGVVVTVVAAVILHLTLGIG
jgi:hypothetical protein